MIDFSRVSDRNFREIPPKLGTMGLLLSALAFVLAFGTASDYGIASDVANYFASSVRQVDWAREFFARLLVGRSEVVTEEAIFEAWRWYLPRLPHPPLSRELGGLTWLLGHHWLDTLTAYRLAVMLAYAALTGWVSIFTFWATRSRIAGLAAGLAVIAYPTLFAHGHLAHTDLFLATFWFAAAASLAVFERTRRIGWLAAAGLLAGAAAATKFSGLLVFPVMAAWLVVRRPREAIPALMIIGLSASALFVLVNPVMWIAPRTGLADYFGAGTSRATDAMTLIRTSFFGTIYEFRPPIYYPWVWTLIVIPPSLLAAAAVGLTTVRRHWVASFCLLNMGVFYAALLLPQAPMHDGVRLFLPVLPFQCVLVGVGVARATEWLDERVPRAGPAWLQALVLVAVIAPAAASTIRSHPYQLSYVNFLAGGTSGAAGRGLEIANLKEAFNSAVLAELDSVIPAGAVVDPGFLTEEVCFYRAQNQATDWVIETSIVGPGGEERLTLTCAPGDLIPRALSRPAREPDFVLLYERPAVWRPLDRALADHGGTPAYQLTYDGVPLVRAYRTN